MTLKPYHLGLVGPDNCKPLKQIFPRASKSFLSANSATLSQPADKNAVAGQPGGKDRMNKTEREFSFLLEAMKRKGEIARYDYEGITLRWEVGTPPMEVTATHPDGTQVTQPVDDYREIIRYTPDFVVFPPAIAVSGQIKFLEVKGPFTRGKFERAIERFRHARTYWPEFLFELHQKTRDGWKRIM